VIALGYYVVPFGELQPADVRPSKHHVGVELSSHSARGPILLLQPKVSRR